ncbi:hypothetical protein B0T21DRAFT_367578 [Apiosordaria backusii]|uniref:Kinesin light chain n=1 Tax=Apiosordaria backusii TaxID=314023 RepID=A0AA40BJM8_9PEZI|nr:hypothetical protein B0T21DRAFT_367578 [Apiosordaria backusii]
MVVDGLNDESSLHWAKDTDTDDERTIWDFIPMGKHASVLVTTRNERLARRFVRRKHQFIVEVNPLGDKDAAFMVLGEHTSNKRKFAQAKELAKQLGGIAGALAYVYAYLTKVDRKMELKAYGDMLKLPESSKPDPIANAVLAWRSLYRALKTKHPEAANLLNSVGVLDVQSIPKDFFQKTDWKLTRTLEAYGMIERSADDRFIRVTGIVRLCLQRYLEERGKKEGVEEKVLEQLCENLKGGHQDLDDALLPSILAALNFQAKSPDSDTKKLAATLHLKVAQYYQHIGRLQAAIRHFEHCLTPRPKDSKRPYFISNEDADSAKKALEQARSDVKKAESSAVSLTKGTKKPALPTVSVPNPREIHTELQHLEKTSGPSHASTIQKVAELAALRLTHPGIRHVNKVNSGNKFADTRGLPAPPGRSPLIPAAHIPPAHAIPVHGTSSAQGRSAAYNSPAASPQPHSPRALSPTVASLPGTHKSSDKLPSGSDHPHQPAPESDDTPEEGPASLYHRLLTTAISHGRDNMHTANAHYSLAIAHESQGDFPQSQTHFFHALSTARTHVGIDSPEYLRMMRALACGYARKGGDYLPQAQQIFAFVLQKQVKTLGETHPETLVTRHNVALFLEEAEEWEAAGEELERILGLQGYLLGRDSQDTLQTACSLAMNYGARGKRKEALELFRATLVTQERVLGETHVDTVTTAERLREFLAEMNVE